jgi:hypothetical protein
MAKRRNPGGQPLSGSSKPSGCSPGNRYATEHHALMKVRLGSCSTGPDIRYPVLEIEARVEPFENGRGFTLRALAARRSRTLVASS